MVHLQNEFYAVERNKELPLFRTGWMELESIMLREISQAVKDIYDLTFKRNLINKTNKEAKYNQRHCN